MRAVIVKLAKMLTDCMDVKMGLVKMEESRGGYKLLERSHPEFVDYVSADDTVKKVVLGGVRRAGRIAVKSLRKRG